MPKRVTLGLVVVGLIVIAGVLLLFRQHAPRTLETTSTAPSPTTEAARTSAAPPPIPAIAEPAKPKAESASITAPVKPAINLGAPVDPAKRAEITAALTELKNLYGDVGTLSWDETKALVAKRRKASDDLVDRLAKLGPGGARAIADVFGEADSVRAKLLLVAALGRIGDEEAAAVLADLMGRDNSYSLRKEIVAALGQRQETASTAVLTGILQTQDDARLRAVSVQALSGRADALPVLTDRIRNDTSKDVVMASIRSVGLIGNDGARNVLTGIAQSTMDLAVRQTAIQELGRTFGAGALGVLEQLLNDPNEAIRENAVTAVARVHNDQAVALLQRTAASDSSAQVRAKAQATLSVAPVQ
jgi:HEAT repeat protein